MIDHVFQMIAGSEVRFGFEEMLEALPFPAWIVDESGKKQYQNRACLLAWGNMIGDRLRDHSFCEQSLTRMEKEDEYVRIHGSLVVENDVFWLRGKRFEYFKKLYFIDGKLLGFCIPPDQFTVTLAFQGNVLTDFRVMSKAQSLAYSASGLELESSFNKYGSAIKGSAPGS